MIRGYIVTEGEASQKLIQKLLPVELIQDIFFVARPVSDYSLATSILYGKRKPTVFVTSANAINSSAIRETEDFLNSEMQRAAAGIPYKVFVEVPEFERIFFQDRDYLEKLLGFPIPDDDWVRAEFIPRKILAQLLEQSTTGITLEGLVDSMTPDVIQTLQDYPLIVGLHKFLQDVLIAEPVFGD